MRTGMRTIFKVTNFETNHSFKKHGLNKRNENKNNDKT